MKHQTDVLFELTQKLRFLEEDLRQIAKAIIAHGLEDHPAFVGMQGVSILIYGLTPVAPRVINLKNYTPANYHDPDVEVIYIGRSMLYRGKRLPKSIWSNPFKIGKDGDRGEVLVKYREYVKNKPELMALLPTLEATTLACWCAPQPCHGDVLIELFNEMAKGESMLQSTL